jgi:hypothetical protein
MSQISNITKLSSQYQVYLAPSKKTFGRVKNVTNFSHIFSKKFIWFKVKLCVGVMLIKCLNMTAK